MQRGDRLIVFGFLAGIVLIAAAAWLTRTYWMGGGPPDAVPALVSDDHISHVSPSFQTKQANEIKLGKMPGPITQTNVGKIESGSISSYQPGAHAAPNIETAKIVGPIRLPTGLELAAGGKMKPASADIQTGKMAGPDLHFATGDLQTANNKAPSAPDATGIATGNVSGPVASVSETNAPAIARPHSVFAPATLPTGSAETQVTSSDHFQNDVGQYVRAMTTDAQSRLWAVSDEHGLWGYDPRLPQGRRTQVYGDSTPVHHLLAVAVDRQSRVWVGNEVDGVWCYDPAASDGCSWRQFQTDEGLGDNHIYALAVDKLGRVWAGHLNHGVSVFNGQKWQNYNVVQNIARDGVSADADRPDPFMAQAGPLGTRVFAIAVNPVDGDVWIGTEAGLTRYSTKDDKWSYFTRNEGLPADGISGIAFDQDGTIYAGTECDGLAIASPKNNFATWRTMTGLDPGAPGSTTPGGEGLPSNFINALATDPSGTLYVGTSLGLAWSSDQGRTFHYIRGKDYADKVKGLFGGPPQGWTEPPKDVMASLLAEDYVTSLAQAGDGPLWIGYRLRMPQAFDRVTRKPTADLDNPAGEAIAKFSSVQHPMVASNVETAQLDEKEMNQTAGDLIKTDKANLAAATMPSTVPAILPQSLPVLFPVVRLPGSAGHPSLEDLSAALQTLSRVPTIGQLNPGRVIAMPDDWNTRGAWLGRYGRYWVCLAATWESQDLCWGPGSANVAYVSRVGPHHVKHDVIRYNIHANHTKNPSSLELPMPYLETRVLKNLTTWDVDRRQSQWDDHGEAYPMTYEGPDLYCTVKIPDGVFVLSLYSDNDGSGGSGSGRLRDFSIAIRPHSSVVGNLYDIRNFYRKPELAHGRLHDHAGGVYKRFLVGGPAELTVKLGRNWSYNTMWQGLMLDRLDEDPAPYCQTLEEWDIREADRDKMRDQWLKEFHDTPAAWEQRFAPVTNETQAQLRLGESLNRLRLVNPAWYASQSTQYHALLLRSYFAVNPPMAPMAEKTLGCLASVAACCYRLNLFLQWETRQNEQGLLTSREIEKGLRWDGSDDTYPAECFDKVTAYRKSNEGIKNRVER